MKATNPRLIIYSVCRFKKLSADIVIPVPSAMKIVTVFINAFCAVSDRRCVTPDSLIRLPNISIPSNAVIEGKIKEIRIVAAMGNTTFSKFVT